MTGPDAGLSNGPIPKPLLSVLKGALPAVPPMWLMRQAGRYLPEYRALRAEKGGFLELVYDSAAAAEVTVQPLRRFGFDGAILFSDILIVPYAMGQDLWFEAGEGPRLAPILARSEEHTSELQSLMRISYAVFCLKKKKLTPLHPLIS